MSEENPLEQPITLSLNEDEVSLIINGLDALWLDTKQLKTRMSIAKKLEKDIKIRRPKEINPSGLCLTKYWDFDVVSTGKASAVLGEKK